MQRKPTKRDGANAKTDRKRPTPWRKAVVRPKTEKVPEYERRFLVLSMDRSVLRGKPKHIHQGYLDDGDGPRLRVTDGKKAVMTTKTGKGLARMEENDPPENHPDAAHPVLVHFAQRQLEKLRYTLTKLRYEHDGWEVDFFEGPLAGLVLAEFEMKSPTDEVVLPPWIHSAIDVTETLTNRMLAKLAYDLKVHGSGRPVREYLTLSTMPIAVLTGGPGSGKSASIERLKATHGDRIHFVPEVATILIGQVGIRPPQNDPVAMLEFQRTVYRIQRRLEAAAQKQAARDGKRLVLADRGTVDAAVYMTRRLADLAHISGGTAEAELARYVAVLCLDPAPADVYELIKNDNPARSESCAQAVALGDSIREVWGPHPGFVRIGNPGSWEEKYAHVTREIERLLG